MLPMMNLNPMALGQMMPPSTDPRLNREDRDLEMYKQFLASQGEQASNPIQSLVRGTARTPEQAALEDKMSGIQSLIERRENIGQKFQGFKQAAQDRGIQFNPIGTPPPATPNPAQPMPMMQPQQQQPEQNMLQQAGQAVQGAANWVDQKVSGIAGGILGEARKYLGTPYKWGGTSPNGFDCSGYTQYVARANGLNIPRTAESQRQWFMKNGRFSTNIGDARPGDMLYFRSSASPSGRHTGIYIGNGKYINAAGRKSGVKISSVNNLPLLGVGKV